MQVLLINGSPHPKGSTATALATVAQQKERTPEGTGCPASGRGPAR